MIYERRPGKQPTGGPKSVRRFSCWKSAIDLVINN